MKMKWVLLSNIHRQSLTRGTLFRFPAEWPYERTIDLMVFDPVNDPDSGMGLIVDSGYKAGLILVFLPQESRGQGEISSSICSDWLKANWRKWVYDVDIDHVRVCASHRPEPRLPEK